MCLMFAAHPALASDVLDDLSRTGLVDKTEEKNDSICQRALYSKSFDNWCKFYLAGKDAEADKEWAKLMPMVKESTSLRPLIRGANTRLQFMEGDEHQQLIERGDSFFADIKMLRATEKALGKNHLQVASIYDYISNCYVDVRNYAKAVEFQRIAYNIRAQKWGKDSTKLANDIRGMASKTFNAHYYDQCKPFAQRMVELGTKYDDRMFVREGNSYLTRMKDAAGVAKGSSKSVTTSPLKPKPNLKSAVGSTKPKTKTNTNTRQGSTKLNNLVDELSK